MSLLRQTQLPAEVIVVDNDSTDETPRVVRELRQAGLPVRRVIEKKVGYPFVYNRGLQTATTEWAAFIDDDCVADEHWYAALQNAIKKYSRAQVFLGQSLTLATNSLWSLATWSLDQLWKNTGLQARTTGVAVSDLGVLDNKNIAYHLPFLRQHKIQFNEEVVTQIDSGAAEDIDLGRQLAVHHANAWYVPAMTVAHQDPTNLGWYWRKLVASAKAVAKCEQRWQRLMDHTKPTSKQANGRLWQQWRQTMTLFHLSPFSAIFLGMILVGSVLVTKIISFKTKHLLWA